MKRVKRDFVGIMAYHPKAKHFIHMVYWPSVELLNKQNWFNKLQMQCTGTGDGPQLWVTFAPSWYVIKHPGQPCNISEVGKMSIGEICGENSHITQYASLVTVVLLISRWKPRSIPWLGKGRYITSRLRSFQTFLKVHTRTHRHCSFIQYGLNHYQQDTNKSYLFYHYLCSSLFCYLWVLLP